MLRHAGMHVLSKGYEHVKDRRKYNELGCQKFDEVIEQKDYLHWHIETKRKRQKKGGRRRRSQGALSRPVAIAVLG